MIVLEEQMGLNAGLNKGLKIGKMLKKNVRLRNVSLKNAVKVGKVAIPIATSFIPGGGVASKLLNSKVGKIFTKVKNGKLVKTISKVAGSKVGKFAINNVVKPMIKQPSADLSEQQIPEENLQQELTPAQVQSIAQVKGMDASEVGTTANNAQIETLSVIKDIPSEDLKQEALSQKEEAQNQSTTTEVSKPNYVLPIVLGVVAVGGIYLATSSTSNQ
jgi:hypothetical protein